MRGLYEWPKSMDVEELPERMDIYSVRAGRPPSRGERPLSRPPSREGTRPPSREGGRRRDPRECEWGDEPQEIILEECFRGQPNMDRAMMIEAASRHLLRRDNSGSVSRVGTPCNTPFRRKEETDHFGCGENSEDYKSMKRPPSRKKNPSQSAVAGLGAFASPVLVTNAFERPKTIRPHIDSMHKRPPSRHKEPPLSLHLGDQEKPTASGRAEASRWACARSTDQLDRDPRVDARPDRAELRETAPSVTAVPIPWQAATATAWTTALAEEKEPLEVSGTGFTSRPSQIAQHGSYWPNGPRMQVEDVDDIDSGIKSLAYKPKIFESRQKCRVRFDTSLEPAFLNLFAT